MNYMILEPNVNGVIQIYGNTLSHIKTYNQDVITKMPKKKKTPIK